jgi:hypothetical protein
VKQQQAMISTVVDDINQPDTTIPSCAKEWLTDQLIPSNRSHWGWQCNHQHQSISSFPSITQGYYHTRTSKWIGKHFALPYADGPGYNTIRTYGREPYHSNPVSHTSEDTSHDITPSTINTRSDCSSRWGTHPMTITN